VSDVDRAGRAHRTFWLTLVGVLLTQSAWLMALPTLRGPDEFDHVYKAAAVARGQLGTEGATPHGRGGVVTVPLSLVTATTPACESRSYTGHDNCHPIDEPAPGLARVATAAGAYNPTWYAVVGTVTRPVDGARLDPAMRAVTALLSALLIAWAAATVTAWSRTRWPLAGLTLAATPTLVYSTVVASPNGVHYAAALLLWAAALGLASGEDRPTRFLVPFVAGAAVLVNTHTTGPLWLALLAVVGLVLRPARDWWRLAKQRPRTWSIAGALTLLATSGSVAWTRLAGANELGAADPSLPPFRLGLLVGAEILWPFQSVGAFPMRDQPAPLAAYAVWFTALVALVVLGLRRGPRRLRLAVGLVGLLVVVVPGALTVLSFSSVGLAWQGRYALPLYVGLPLLAAWSLDRRGASLDARVTLLLGGALGVAGALCVNAVAGHERAAFATPPLSGTLTAGSLVMTVLALVGPLLCAHLANPRSAASAPVGPTRVPVPTS
jgi:hypothetical protein